MKYRWHIYLLIPFSIFLLLSFIPENNRSTFNQAENKNNPVIVELFTSQGCSNCPSADRLLSDLVDNSKGSDIEVIGLSFHVSYWNYLGWKDPYSDNKYTERQRKYGAIFQNASIYTPQMIVNGKDEFVGSNRYKATVAIKKNTFSQLLDEIEIISISKINNQLEVHFSMKSKNTSSLLNVALVERDIENFVPKGENGGRTLKHDNVVKYFETKETTTTDHKIDLPLHSIDNMEAASLIIYTQNTENWHVQGAKQVFLENL